MNDTTKPERVIIEVEGPRTFYIGYTGAGDMMPIEAFESGEHYVVLQKDVYHRLLDAVGYLMAQRE